MPRHSELFLEARRPRVVVLHPEPEWVLDSYRVRSWYYRDAPAVGDKVTYLRDGFSTRISRVNFSRIYFEDSTSMRRPELGRRVGAWVLPRLHMNSLAERIATARSAVSPIDTRTTPTRSRLRPDATTLLV